MEVEKYIDDKLSESQVAILEALLSGSEELVLKTLEIIKENGGDFVVKALMSLYFTTPFEAVKKEIIKLFADIRDNNCSDIISTEILNYKEKEELHKLLSALWQSSLKIKNLNSFFNLFFEASDLVALECSTIITTNVGNLSEENIAEYMEFMKSNVLNLNEFKKQLAIDILEALN